MHIEFTPDSMKKAHWNNESGEEGLTVWLTAPRGWEIDRRLVQVAGAAEDVSSEPRRVEFELRGKDGASADVLLTGYALYYVCEDVTGVCLYRWQDFENPVKIE